MNNTFLKFKELLKFVFENKYSDFYRVKYEKARFNPLTDFNSMDDIKKIPFLTKEEFSSADPLKFLFVPEKEVDFIAQTSGTTTGKPSFIFYSKYSPLKPDPAKLEWKWKKQGETIKKWFLLHPFGAFLAYFVWRTTKKGKEWFLAGDIYNIPFSCYSASGLGVNVIITTPTLAIILKDYLERYPDLKKSLKFFILGGEMVTPNKKRFLRELYPDLEISLAYGSAETVLTGFQCPYLTKKEDEVYFHPNVNDFHFEIINPDTGKEVKLGEKGELVVTSFKNRGTPLIRYKTGDLTSFKENNCPCGLPGSLLQTWGRVNYDIVKAGGFDLRTEMLEKPLLNLRDYLQDTFEAHIYENFVGTKPKIKVALNLSLKEGVEESPELYQRIENEFLENWQLSPRLNLKGAVEAGLFEPLQINFVKFPKSPKVKRVLILH